MNTRAQDLERLRNLARDKAAAAPAIDAGGPPPPGDDEGFSAAWCSDALNVEVVAVRETTLGDDTPGFLGQLRRLHLEYAEADAGPATLVAKRNSPEEFNRAIATSMGFYEREFRAYRQLADAIPLRMPVHYYSAFDGDRFVLLIEDLGGARCGRQSECSDVADIERVVDEAALLHGTFFGSPLLDEMPWIQPLGTHGAIYDAAFGTRWEGFVQHFSDKVPAEAIAAGERLLGRMHEVVNVLADGDVTLIHGDYRIDNVIFDAPPEPERPLIIDWQGIGRGQGVFDIAQIVALSFDPPTRRAVERDLLERYARRLEEITGTALARDELFQGYRLALSYPFIMGVAQTDMDTAQAGSDPGIWVTRAAYAVADHGSPDWLAN